MSQEAVKALVVDARSAEVEHPTPLPIDAVIKSLTDAVTADAKEKAMVEVERIRTEAETYRLDAPQRRLRIQVGGGTALAAIVAAGVAIALGHGQVVKDLLQLAGMALGGVGAVKLWEQRDGKKTQSTA